jgi:hypothetical protein
MKDQKMTKTGRKGQGRTRSLIVPILAMVAGFKAMADAASGEAHNPAFMQALTRATARICFTAFTSRGRRQQPIHRFSGANSL